MQHQSTEDRFAAFDGAGMDAQGSSAAPSRARSGSRGQTLADVYTRSDGLLPSADVKGMASKFTGGSMPQPEASFQQVRLVTLLYR